MTETQTTAKPQHTGTAIPLPEVPPGVEVIRDVSFGAHERQAYDVYLPEGATRPLPVVVFLHPGAWQRRDKRAVRTMFVLEHGFALVSIGYRLAQQARFPAQVQDVNDGLRHLLDHADEYGIDPDRMVLAGTSAGAHLASLAVLAKDHAAFHPVEGLAPRGIVSVYGAYDMPKLLEGATDLSTDHVSAESPLGLMFGAPPLTRMDLLREVSPASYIRSDAPPFLILHGREDHVLPWQQSAEFATRLIEAGVNTTLQVVPHVGHGAEAFRTGPVADEITAFVKRVTDAS
ncbi:alpha/beta hydrolase fold domain-containing protein [Litorisediminicola beolgyonensis]|uniref:Alpha/beta hydrolase fold domain-containing protein n=1 Tax=Litorisediminicola beolgyonensis TaxID=1173614 RepID=A0ABW3ZJA8_9RHOB